MTRLWLFLADLIVPRPPSRSAPLAAAPSGGVWKGAPLDSGGDLITRSSKNFAKETQAPRLPVGALRRFPLKPTRQSAEYTDVSSHGRYDRPPSPHAAPLRSRP